MDQATVAGLGRRIVDDVSADEASLFELTERRFYADAATRASIADGVLGRGGVRELEFGPAEAARLVVDFVLVVANGLATGVLVELALKRLSRLRQWQLRRRLAKQAAPQGGQTPIPLARDAEEAHQIGEYIYALGVRAKLDPNKVRQVATAVTAAMTPPIE